MSKSLGNLVFVSELAKIADPRAIRLALMSHHYRDDWEWLDDDINAAAESLELLLTAANAAAGPDPTPFASRFRAALDNDLNAPRARAELLGLAEAVVSGGDDPSAPAVLRELAGVCGIELDNPAAPVP